MMYVYEGPDGSGKSTAAAALSRRLGIPLVEELARPLLVYGPAEAERRAPGFLPAMFHSPPLGASDLEVRAVGDAWHLATALLARGGADFVADRHWPSMLVYQRAHALFGAPRPPLAQYLMDPGALARAWAPFTRLVFLDAEDAVLEARIRARGEDLRPGWAALVAREYRLLREELSASGVAFEVERTS